MAFIFLIFVLLFFYCWSRRKIYVLSSQLEGPPALPLVGNGLKFVCKKEDVLDVFIKSLEPYPSPTKMWFGPRLVVFIKDPQRLQLILQSSKMTTKAFFYKFLEPFLGQGLFTAAGTRYKIQKKILQPLFSQKMVATYCHTFQKHAKKLIEVLERHEGGEEFNVLMHLHDTAFELTMELLLEDKNNHSLDYKDIPQYVRRFYNIVFARITKFWLHFDFIFKLTSYYKDQKMMKDLAKTMIEEILFTTVPKIVQRLIHGDIKNSTKKIKTSVLEKMAQMVIENPKNLTIEDCVDHLMTFVATSQDSQSSAIAFTCMMLGAYPEIQERVIKEMRQVLETKTTLEFDDVSKLTYLDMCLKETLRLYPVAPFIFRDTTEDFQLEKLLIPKDVTIALSLYHAHRDPQFWEKPKEYFPEHFTGEAISKRHPFAYLPFSAGPRKCIAQQYSWNYMKIQIATILLNYEIQCRFKVEDIKLTTDISVRPVEGYLIKIKKRV